MKFSLSLLSLACCLIGATSLQATTVRYMTARAQAGRVVAVCETQHVVVPIVYTWNLQLPPGTAVTADMANNDTEIPDLEFPGILLAEPARTFPDTSSKPLYIDDKVTAQYTFHDKT